MQSMLVERLSFKAVEDHDRYLGLPTYIGRSKKKIFDFVVERLWKKLKGWKEKLLSRAGKEILIKAVAQAIPSYNMQCFRFPIAICDKLQSLCSKFWWGKGEDLKGVHWVKWEKMCSPKFNGGMGFREFQCFNQALIAKQVWRIIQEPSSLASKVLKAKYFRKCDIMEASVGFQPSYLWRSLIWGRELLNLGIVWRVGNGQKIRIWKDYWVENDSREKIQFNQCSMEGNETVAELIDVEGEGWRKDIIEGCFEQHIAKQILSMPIGDAQLEDVRIWSLCDDGCYRVSSGYRNAFRKKREISDGHGESSIVASECWKRLWRVKVMPKVNHCLWRAWMDSIPTRTNLVRRGFEVDPRCPMCGEDFEHPQHIFIGCDFARSCWLLSCLRGLSWTGGNLSFQEVLIHVVNSLPEEVTSIIWTIIWAIWGARNKWVMEGVWSKPEVVVSRAMAILKEYEKAMEATVPMHHSVRNHEQKWTKPKEGAVMLNTDGSVIKGGWGGLGITIRNSSGEVLAAKQVVVQGCNDAEVCEARAVLEGLRFAKQLNFKRVEVNSDCATVINMMKLGSLGFRPSRVFVFECFKLCDFFDEILFAHIRRTGNRAAHILANNAAKLNVSGEWIESCPDSILNVVRDDASAS